MTLRRVIIWTSLAFLLSPALPAGAQEQPPAAAPQLQPGYVEVPAERGERSGPAAPAPPSDPDLERARAAARGAGEGAPKEEKVDEGLERARAAARAAEPRLQGVERERQQSRKSAGRSGGTDCLSAREARNAILSKRAVTLSEALRVAREAWAGEVIDYKLCTFDGSLAYDLTLLNGDGKVARVRIAADGKLLGVR